MGPFHILLAINRTVTFHEDQIPNTLSSNRASLPRNQRQAGLLRPQPPQDSPHTLKRCLVNTPRQSWPWILVLLCERSFQVPFKQWISSETWQDTVQKAPPTLQDPSMFTWSTTLPVTGALLESADMSEYGLAKQLFTRVLNEVSIFRSTSSWFVEWKDVSFACKTTTSGLMQNRINRKNEQNINLL